jgi:molybdopterin converting factor small subunit
MTTVRVRLFASLRELAGASELEAEGGSVDEIMSGLTERFGNRFGEIARAGSVVIDGERAELGHRVADGAEIALLPPFSGG